MTAKTSTPIGRRNFLKAVGLSASGFGLAACTTRPTLVNPAPTTIAPTASMADHEMAIMPPQQGTDADEMDRMHEEGVNIFLAGIGKDPAFWGTPLEFTKEDGFKVFTL